MNKPKTAKEVQRCYRCGSFDVTELKTDRYKIPIYHKLKNTPVHILPTGEVASIPKWCPLLKKEKV